MAPTVGTYASGTTSVAIDYPTSVANGDLEIIVLESTDSSTTGGTPTTPTGGSGNAWAKLGERNQPTGAGTGVTTLTVFAKLHETGDATSTQTVDGVGDHCSGYMIRIPAADHGCSSTTDIVVGTMGGSTNSTNSTAGITVTAGSTVFLLYSTSRDANSTANFSDFVATDPATLTELGDQSVSTGAGGGVGLAWGTCAGTSTGSGSATVFNANNNSVFIGVKPPATPVVIDVTTPGAITLAGTTIGLTTSLSVVAGALTLAGAGDIVLVEEEPGPVVIDVTVPGAITLTGSTVALVTTLTTEPGAFTLTGSTVGLTTTLTPVAGAFGLAGQDVELKTTLVLAEGVLTLAGLPVSLKTEVSLVAGQLSLAGATDIVLVTSGGEVVGFIVFSPVGL